jgi:predicted alpha/beta-fold hydrolase
MYTDFQAPLHLTNGLTMTMHAALRAGRTWERYTVEPEPIDQEHIFSGANDVPIYGRVSIPKNPRGTIVATYGITGTLDNQWFLKALRRKAYAQGWAVVLFDWRAHGQTALLSPQLTSDGIYEGEDFLQIAAQAKVLGCPAPMWLSGYSLGGQLALWGIKQAPVLSASIGLDSQDIAGGFVICPSLESDRSLTYLVNHPIKSILENRIAKELKKLAWQLQAAHPQDFDPAAIDRANSIEGFDRELVIPRLGFATVKDYYLATSPLYFLDKLTLPTLIIYAADDPLFNPSLVSELASIAKQQPAIDLMLTKQGGHVGYISSTACQQQYLDADPWWAWNRALEWVQQ